MCESLSCNEGTDLELAKHWPKMPAVVCALWPLPDVAGHASFMLQHSPEPEVGYRERPSAVSRDEIPSPSSPCLQLQPT